MRHNLNEIKTVFDKHEYSINTIVTDLMKKFNFKTICCSVGIRKEQGYTPSEIIMLMIMMPLMLLNSIHSFYKVHYQKLTEMKKDSIYRLKNNEKMPWRGILYAVGKKFNQLVAKNSNAENVACISALIIDDTPEFKTGRRIEKVSYIHDHTKSKKAKKSFCLGFKNLMLAYFDGKSLIPIDFSLHTEKELKGKKKKEQYKKEVSQSSNGFKRRNETQTQKNDNAITMIKRAVKNGFVAKYVLADSWFTSIGFIKTIRSIKKGAMHMVGCIKNDNRKYCYKNSQLNSKELITKLRADGKEKRNRRFNVRYFEVTVNYGDIGEVKLFLSRLPYNKQWRVFLSTDLELDITKMLEIYSMRWTIEVMFKELKQYLGLGKCQSRDFDAQIASVTISCILYVFLAYKKRMCDYETIGGIFKLANYEIAEHTLAERMWDLFLELLQVVIDTISKNGTVDLTLFMKSEEFKFIKEMFDSSFLGNQLDKLNKSA